MFGFRATRGRRARLVPVALTTAALSSAVVGASMTGTLSAFEATITNSQNTAISGSLVMVEVNGDWSAACTSSSGPNNSYASCDRMNKYGGTDTPFIPGATHSTTVYLANNGSSAVRSFTVEPGRCTLSRSSVNDGQDTGDLCASLHLTVTCTPVDLRGAPVGSSTTVYDARPLADVAESAVDVGALSAVCVPQAAAANAVRFVFSVKMPEGQDNTVQGQAVSQPIVWTFTGA